MSTDQEVPKVHDELLTPSELAEWLRIPLGTLYGWRYEGRGPTGIKVGRHLRYRTSDVQQWLAEHEGGGDAA